MPTMKMHYSLLHHCLNHGYFLALASAKQIHLDLGENRQQHVPVQARFHNLYLDLDHDLDLHRDLQQHQRRDLDPHQYFCPTNMYVSSCDPHASVQRLQ
jgi:hypothetical protein